MIVVDSPPNTMPEIPEIWAFLSVDADGNEGVCARWTRDGWLPLIAANPTRLEQLRPVALLIARETSMRVRLVHFSRREVLEVIDGGH